jgi:hypothetical protein
MVPTAEESWGWQVVVMIAGRDFDIRADRSLPSKSVGILGITTIRLRDQGREGPITGYYY